MSESVLRVANCSGFYGDKLGAAHDLVHGGPIDVLTGDYLAELTMAILHRQKLEQRKSAGYVGIFLKQLRQVMQPCLEKGIRIVSNAGGLNSAGMAADIEALCRELGLDAKIAYIDGDDLTHRVRELQHAGEKFENLDSRLELGDQADEVLTANAYLGGWGIKTALDKGADVVVCPRVTDAALVIGPAAWKFNWNRDDYDELAGALTAGHIIECGAQATGGNYAFFQEVETFRNIGYPIAEIARDGSFEITKHPGTGGLVSTGTVRAQLLYEIGSAAYVNPDVVAHFDSISIGQAGPDRVRISGCRGSSPPPSHKVCMNLNGGYRNGTEVLLTGLDIEDKARVFTEALFEGLGGAEQFDEVDTLLIRSDRTNPSINEEAIASLRIDVKSRDPKVVGRIFSAKVIELALANFPGFSARGAPGSGVPVLRHWPTLVDSRHIVERVHCDDEITEVLPGARLGLPERHFNCHPAVIEPLPEEQTVSIPLGRLFGARSGDKGGNANLGVWARTEEAHRFLHHFLTPDRLKSLCEDLRPFAIDRFDLPNLQAVNFVIHGLLGEGVAANTRLDGQAKTLCEYVRGRIIDVPVSISG